MEEQAKQQQTWWQKVSKPLAIAGIIVACALVILLVVALIGGYLFNWDWTGFSGGVSKVTTTIITPEATTVTPGESVATEQQPAKTLWDWLGLLGILAIPVVVGFGVALFTAQQAKESEANREKRHQTDLEIAEKNREREQ